MIHNLEHRINALPKGILFNCFLFITFCSPSLAFTTIKIAGIYTNSREIGCILLPIIYSLTGKFAIHLVPQSIVKSIKALLIAIIVVEAMKILVDHQSPIDTFKGLRKVLPFISGIILAIQGVRINPKIVLNTLFAAVIFSVVITLLFIVAGINPMSQTAGDDEIGYGDRGRFGNQNMSFGLIAVGLIFNISALDKKYKYFYLVTMCLGILSIFLSFNRTLSAAIVILLLFFSLKKFNPKVIVKVLAVSAIAGGAILALYNSNKTVAYQIDKRILTIIQSDNAIESIKTNAIEGNRDILYEGFYETFKSNWLYGTPYKTPWFVREDGSFKRETDISLYTIVLQFGIVVLLLFVVLLYKIYMYFKQSKADPVFLSMSFIFFIACLASFNIDLFARHNFLFYIMILMMFYPIYSDILTIERKKNVTL